MIELTRKTQEKKKDKGKKKEREERREEKEKRIKGNCVSNEINSATNRDESSSLLPSRISRDLF